MKLIRAEFCNFRLLRDLVIDFSGDKNKNLTVIRAENETGKTTILTALQWALYGDSALPNRGKDFRLHPLDWNQEESNRVSVVVTVDFEISKFWKKTETKHRYRIVRSAFELLDGTEWSRNASTVHLYRLTDTGTELIESPESFINDELPPELREVFFTDGDRALSFVDADVSATTKRARVQSAIRSLLGLGVLEDAKKHVKKTAQEINSMARGIDGGGDLSNVADRINKAVESLDSLEKDNKDAEGQFSVFESLLLEVEGKITEALKRGDKDALSQELENVRGRIRQLDTQIQDAGKEHVAIFKEKSLACDLLKPIFKEAARKLDKLHDQGKIPNTTIPVLEDRLAANQCICGESLDSKDPAGKARRLFIENSIKSSKQSDENRKIVTELYYASKGLLSSASSSESSWLPKYSKVEERRVGLQDLRLDAGRKLKSLEKQLDELPDVDIQGLRETRRNYQQQRDRFLRVMSTTETQISNLKREIDQLKIDRERLLRDKDKGLKVLADLKVSQDVLNVFQRAYDRMTTEELSKVSTLMNDIFMEMIGADPEQGSIIKKAEINNDFEIIVYGPNGKTLNTGTDLNGASRRALTISFILALTKVSEVEAPNVIDTPLGMMSGLVKRSVLKQAISKSTQLILFLTRSEIAGCEDILEEKAGGIITLTNPAHYPKILINDPGVTERKVLRCDCGYNEACKLCDRRLDAEITPELEEAM